MQPHDDILSLLKEKPLRPGAASGVLGSGWIDPHGLEKSILNVIELIRCRASRNVRIRTYGTYATYVRTYVRKSRRSLREAPLWSYLRPLTDNYASYDTAPRPLSPLHRCGAVCLRLSTPQSSTGQCFEGKGFGTQC